MLEGAYRRPRAGEHLKRGPAPNGSARPGPGSTGTEARTGLSSREDGHARYQVVARVTPAKGRASAGSGHQ